ncbi:hypothetical protein CBR_g402 [Chara braunii]|uniref:F-box domain-containing protein n=1 Tax=Chara braunii TaxID=69332 RepID=A0A388JQL3_CHABU|nr:hypothetical protein CBR_g402 [Chara braunii]|eukprot:GBG60071.1 hypothetical protein CBR_g402 [Chara braunii]
MEAVIAVCAGQTRLKRLELWSVFGRRRRRWVNRLLKSCPQLEHLKIGNVPPPASFILSTSCVPPPVYHSPPHGAHSSLELGVDVDSHAQLRSIVDIFPIAWANPTPPSLYHPLPRPLPPPCPPLLPELVSSNSPREEGHDYSGNCSDAAGAGNEVEGERPRDEGLWEGERPRDEASGPSYGGGEGGGGDEEVETERQAQRDGYGEDEDPVPTDKFFSIWLPPDRDCCLAPTVFPPDSEERGVEGDAQGVEGREDQEEEDESGGSSSTYGDWLTLSHPILDELSIVSIAKNCPRLKTLHLSANNLSANNKWHRNCCFTERSMTALVHGCTALTDLSLTTGAANFYMRDSHSAVRVLSGCNQLRNLSLCGFWPAASDALQDGSCPLLSSLSLAESSLLKGDQDSQSLSPSFFCFQSTRRRTLTSLCVTDSLYFDDEQLDVSGTRVSDWGIIAAVRACTNLQTLVASRCKYVTDSSVRVVAAEAGRQLRELCLDETGVTHYALSFLARGTRTLGLVKLLLYGSQPRTSRGTVSGGGLVGGSRRIRFLNIPTVVSLDGHHPRPRSIQPMKVPFSGTVPRPVQKRSTRQHHHPLEEEVAVAAQQRSSPPRTDGVIKEEEEEEEEKEEDEEEKKEEEEEEKEEKEVEE